MEIQLAKIYDNFPEEEIKVHFLDIISVEQFQKINEAISEVNELHYTRQLMGFVKTNDKEIINFLKNFSEALLLSSIKWNSVKREDGSKLFFNTNRLFLNYLSSIRTYIDHSETFLNRKYGKDSSQFIEFKKMLSYFYDNSFAYCFLYKLRNYAQHVGLPINIIRQTSENNRDNNLIKQTLSVKFNKESLLSKYDKWGTVRNKLNEMELEFDVTPLIFEMTHNIREIQRNLELICKKEFSESANYISEMVKHLKNGDGGEIFIAHDFKTKENGELKEYSSIDIPFEIIEYIQENLN